MAERSWFYASNGQQQGPVPETQFRDLIARGSVTPDTLVWSDGMTGWQRAGEIPGLMTGARPPGMPQGGPAPVMTGAGYGGGALTIDFGIWDFTWRSLLFLLGSILVIPVPWVLCWYLAWLVSCVQVPGRPNMSFTGRPGTITKWYFGAIAVIIVIAVIAAIIDSNGLSHAANIIQIVLYWLFLCYLIANLASNGQPLGLTFSGSFWAYLGYTILTVLAVITIIGWAWVIAAQARWVCRNIQGTRRQVVYKGTGLENLWRVIVLAIGCAFIIPIPWMYRWIMRWQLSQTVLVERT
jgi:hypothetical protein